MKQFDITGMTCAACSSRVEKAVSVVPGVTSCSVNLLTNSMTVEGDVNCETVINAVEKAGYGAKEKSENMHEDNAKSHNKEENSEERTLIHCLGFSVALLLVLMYFSMGQMMFSLPLPGFFI